MALHHHVPTEDLSSTVALFMAAGGILGLLLAVLFWIGPDPQAAAEQSAATNATPAAKAITIAEPAGQVPQLVVGTSLGEEQAPGVANEDVTSLLQWLEGHPNYSLVVVPRR